MRKIFYENTLTIQLDSNSLDETIKKAKKLKTLLVEVKELLREITGTSPKKDFKDNDTAVINGEPIIFKDISEIMFIS